MRRSTLLSPLALLAAALLLSSRALAQDAPPAEDSATLGAPLPPPQEQDDDGAPAAPVVTSSLSLRTPLPQSAPLGAPLAIELDVVHPPDVTLSLPDTPHDSRYEILSRTILPDPAQAENAPPRSHATLVLLPVRAGSLHLEQLSLSILSADGELVTLPLGLQPIKILSTLPDDAPATLAAPRPPRPISQKDNTPLYVLALCGGLLLLGGLTAWTVRHLKPEPPPAPPRPIDQVANEALDELEASALLAQGELVEYYTQLSEIFRDYLGKRYGFPGVESTTAEIVAAIPLSLLPASLGLQELSRWLRHCDRVKFSSLRPETHEAEEALRQARAMIALTPPLPPVVEEEATDEPHDLPQIERSLPESEVVTELAPPTELAESSEVPEREEHEERADEITPSEEAEAPAAAALFGAMSWEELSAIADSVGEEDEEEERAEDTSAPDAEEERS